MDQELAKIISDLANEARLSVLPEIPGFLASRNISSLYHFTSVKNLKSIVLNGFLGRETLDKRKIKYIFSDGARDEPLIDGICFSLSRPNIYMAAKKIKRGLDDLILLELQNAAYLLTQFNFVAIPGNFGGLQFKSRLQNWPEEFIGAKGLLNLFNSEIIRRKYRIPIYEPTDPQAEIIILDPVPWTCVYKIYFPNSLDKIIKEQINQIISQLPTGYVLQSQIKDVFPIIDWRLSEISSEFKERKWNENWNTYDSR